MANIVKGIAGGIQGVKNANAAVKLNNQMVAAPKTAAKPTVNQTMAKARVNGGLGLLKSPGNGPGSKAPLTQKSMTVGGAVNAFKNGAVNATEMKRMGTKLSGVKPTVTKMSVAPNRPATTTPTGASILQARGQTPQRPK